MTGHTDASGRVKCDLLLECCKTRYLGKQVKRIVTNSAEFADVLVAVVRQYPSYETDPSIQTNPERGHVAQQPKGCAYL